MRSSVRRPGFAAGDDAEVWGRKGRRARTRRFKQWL